MNGVAPVLNFFLIFKFRKWVGMEVVVSQVTGVVIDTVIAIQDLDGGIMVVEDIMGGVVMDMVVN